MLYGRRHEQATIDRLLTDARSGWSRSLVIRGAAGIGKSALVDYAATAASGMQVVRGVGVESEAELAFGALHLLLYPYLDRLDTLPAPQAAALRAAFGETDVAEPNRFLVGAATLTLLADLAAQTPLLCLIDDAQWLDAGSSGALMFAARRFHADPIAVIFGVRDTTVGFATPGIDTLRVEGLSGEVAAELLDARAPGLTLPGRARVLAESAGNPLALIELGSARRSAERAGDPDPVLEVGPLPVTRRVQETFRAQIAGLPAATRTMLVVAAADTGAGLATMLRVGAALGVSDADLEPAEVADLVSVSTDHVTFRHPLIRAAAYQQAPHHHRIAVHEQFAAVSGDADRRTWHLAAATTDPDEDVAEQLERTAERAQHRGGAMAVSAAYDRAGRLSVDRERKAGRFLKAARAAYDAGKPGRATRLAAEAAAITDDRAIAADATFIRAQIEYERTSPVGDARLALEAAELVVDTDPERAVAILTEVMCVARDAADPDLIATGIRHLTALRLPDHSPYRRCVTAQTAWGDVFAGRPERAVAVMAAHISFAFTPEADLFDKIVAAFSGVMLADDASAVAVMERAVAQARSTGALLWIPYTLEFVAIGQALLGEFVKAEVAVAEGISLSTELAMTTQVAVFAAIAIWLAAVSGDVARVEALGAQSRDRLIWHPTNAAFADWGIGLLELSAGRIESAEKILESVCSGPARNDFLVRAVPDHVEAAVRGGSPAAREHLPRFEHWAEQVDSPLAAALVARCRALLDEDAQAHFETALRHHDRHRGPFDRARTQLVYGEWLRRRRRRTDARVQLVAATETFDRLGARLWAQRGRTELAALGAVASTAPENPLKQLTPQEMQVVRLAAAGLSNKEIGAQLFLSPRTVGHHLYKAYPKLGVGRRIELAQLEL